MVSSVASPADVVNLALAVIGHPGRVANLFDGSDAATKALDVYAQTRDEVLRSKDWSFSLRQAAAVAATAVVSGWAHSWQYPGDCLRLRSVAPHVIPSPNFDPQPVLWQIFNDQTTSPPTRVVLSQITPVDLNYVGRITDMLTWEPLFVDVLVQRLSQRLTALRREIAPVINPQAALAEAVPDELLAPDDAAVEEAPAQDMRRRA